MLGTAPLRPSTSSSPQEFGSVSHTSAAPLTLLPQLFGRSLAEPAAFPITVPLGSRHSALLSFRHEPATPVRLEVICCTRRIILVDCTLLALKTNTQFGATHYDSFLLSLPSFVSYVPTTVAGTCVPFLGIYWVTFMGLHRCNAEESIIFGSALCPRKMSCQDIEFPFLRPQRMAQFIIKSLLVPLTRLAPNAYEVANSFSIVAGATIRSHLVVAPSRPFTPPYPNDILRTCGVELFSPFTELRARPVSMSTTCNRSPNTAFRTVEHPMWGARAFLREGDTFFPIRTPFITSAFFDRTQGFLRASGASGTAAFIISRRFSSRALLKCVSFTLIRVTSIRYDMDSPPHAPWLALPLRADAECRG
ncbi:hypothetical protein B0H11DRAFT_1899542 [Mycena galericulata]|nr:hypothetical protein B0H11DRAFT_1899542 [Mycena galericulata]